MAKKPTLNGRIETLKDFEKKLLKKVLDNPQTKSKFKNKILPVITETINKGIEDSKENFRPRDIGGERLVGELGVGTGGHPDNEKVDKAWEVLQFVGNLGSSVSKLSLSFASGSKFAKFEFSIDKEKFYKSFRANYVSISNGKAVVVPWMKNFLIGIPTIDGFGYVQSGDKKFKPAASRTGIGHMVKVKIPSKQFSLHGYGEDKAFGLLIENVKQRLDSSKFAKELADRIKKASRR